MWVEGQGEPSRTWRRSNSLFSIPLPLLPTLNPDITPHASLLPAGDTLGDHPPSVRGLGTTDWQLKCSLRKQPLVFPWLLCDPSWATGKPTLHLSFHNLGTLTCPPPPLALKTKCTPWFQTLLLRLSVVILNCKCPGEIKILFSVGFFSYWHKVLTYALAFLTSQLTHICLDSFINFNVWNRFLGHFKN